ncbi:MAG: glyoxalase [Chloroflexi bacterium]|nr:glyoxalase [Chloroflexota bacterium]
MMRIKGLHHPQITITVGGEYQAHHFYCETLGLPLIDPPEEYARAKGFWIRVGDQPIRVATEHSLDYDPVRSHLVYEVEDIYRWRLYLYQRGVKARFVQSPLGYARLEMRDPFGNRVELIELAPVPTEQDFDEIAE